MHSSCPSLSDIKRMTVRGEGSRKTKYNGKIVIITDDISMKEGQLDTYTFTPGVIALFLNQVDRVPIRYEEVYEISKSVRTPMK